MQFGRTVARFDFSLKYLPHSFARPRFEPLSFWPACLAAYLTPGPELFDTQRQCSVTQWRQNSRLTSSRWLMLGLVSTGRVSRPSQPIWLKRWASKGSTHRTAGCSRSREGIKIWQGSELCISNECELAHSTQDR